MKHVKLFEQFINEQYRLNSEQQARFDKILDEFNNKEIKNPDTGRKNKISSFLNDVYGNFVDGSDANKALYRKLNAMKTTMISDFYDKAEEESKKSGGKSPNESNSKLEKLEKKKEKLEDKLSQIRDDIRDIADEYGENDIQIQDLEEKEREIEFQIEKIDDQIAKLKK
jgi:septal ring factor EnvC (AmiA/AmiB activator)